MIPSFTHPQAILGVSDFLILTGHSSTRTRLGYGCCWNPVIIVYKVLNMDFFFILLQKNALFRFRRPLLTAWSRMDHFYDGWMSFFGLQNLLYRSIPFKSLEEPRTFVWLKEESHIHMG